VVIARRYQELVCWQLANELKREVYAFTAIEPALKDFKYCTQIRDAARSTTSNMAEGFGRFRPADFARFLEIARASLLETDNLLCDGRQLGYLSETSLLQLRSLADRATGASTNLLKYLKKRSLGRRPI
jgi:four helix bundle protein